MTEERLTPPRTKGRTSAARVADDWYIVCASGDLRDRPLPITLLGSPLVVFRTETGRAATLLDRCAHRNVPLSLGRVKRETLECGYHGWCFDAQGSCRDIPGLVGAPEGKGRRVPSFPTRELDGYVWVYATPDVEPARDPHRFPFVADPRYTTVEQSFSVSSTLHAAAENALDVPHTNFLHRGLFRAGEAKREIDVVVRRTHDRVEAEYIGEPRPSGLVGKILSPSGGVVTHFDRFILPSIVEVEYRLGDDSHVHISNALTPVSDFETRMFAVISFRVPYVPGRLVAPVVKPIALKIFEQDAEVLEAQSKTVKQFGGELYVSTEIDVLGPHILRLLRRAERGHRDDTGEAPLVKSFKMKV